MPDVYNRAPKSRYFSYSPTTMIIRAFDGILREVQCEIELAIRIGPRPFMVNFQVIKLDSPYNMLQGLVYHYYS